MKVSRWADRISLRWLLVGLATVPTLLTGSLVSALVFHSRQKAVRELAQDIFYETSLRINEHLNWLVSIPPRVTQESHNALSSDRLDLEDLSNWSNEFLPKIQSHSELRFLYFGTADNRHVEVSYLPDDSGFTFRIKPVSTEPTLEYSLDENGRPADFQGSRQFDPVARPWFQQAVVANRPIWSSIYKFAFSESVLGITFARPYFNSDGQLLGVFGADFTLDSLQQFLTQLPVTESSEVLLLERSGNLIASSIDNLSPTDNSERIHLDSINHPTVRATSQAIRDRQTSLLQLETPDQWVFRQSGQQYRARIFPFTDEFGLDWLIVVIIPNADLVGSVPSDVTTTALACLAVTLASIAAGIYVARSIQQPLQVFSDVAEEFTQHQRLKTVPEIGPPETQKIAQSHNRMATKLGELLEDLEGQVDERTRQLDSRLQELQTTQALLKNSETKLLEAQRVARMGNWVHILSTDEVHWSQEMIQLMGFDPAQPPPPKDALMDVLDDGEIDRYIASVRNTIITGQPFEVEVRLKTQKERHLKVRGEVSCNDTGTPLELVGTALDITELKQTEAALAQAKREAERANLAKGQFLANMSHELRNPLNGILGYIQLIQRDQDLPPPNSRYLETIGHCGEHLLELIDDVLDMAKIEAGQMSVAPVTFDLYSLLNSVEQLNQLRAMDKGLTFNFFRSVEVPQFVCADTGKLRQILTNLLSNAVKFTQTGGIVVRTYCKAVEEFSTTTSSAFSDQPARRPQNNESSKASLPLYLYFEVEDTGVGIAPQELDTIFDLFGQSTKGRQSGKGTGLGLPISRQFARMMGGDVTVDSHVGQGSIFRVEILANYSSSAQLPTTTSHQTVSLSSHQPNYKILVADDREDNRNLLLETLQRVGFSVMTANDGDQAVSQWIQWQPDFIWMDLRMDGMSGGKAVRRIRQLEREQKSTKQTAIVALTASVIAEEHQAAIDAGCDDCICKPYKLEAIYETLAKYLGAEFDYQRPLSSAPVKTDYPLDDLVELARQMPEEWLYNLRSTAQCLDEEGVNDLLKDMTSEHIILEQSLKYWAQIARFDRILLLIDKVAT